MGLGKAVGCSPYQLMISLLMVITGSINTLSVKWANLLPSLNTVGAGVVFDHPFLQSTGMFMGELCCLIVFQFQVCYYKSQGSDRLNEETQTLKPFSWKKCWLMIPAAVCDMSATSVMYVALTLTSASSFQMLRGAVMIFTGINSMLFLKKRLEWFRWAGMVVVCGGLVMVGAADFLHPPEEVCYSNTSVPQPPHPTEGEFKVYPLEPVCGEEVAMSKEVLGDILVIAAQIVVSIQMVYEEKVISGYNIAPMQAVGWEGFFGFFFMSILLIIFAYIDTGSRQWGHSPVPPWVLEDAVDGFTQLGNSGLLLFSFLMTVVSIAFFNFAGMTVTKELSATTRMVLDSVRTLVIWIFSLAVGWQTFQPLTLGGFIILIIGMSLYNDLIIMPAIRKCMKSEEYEVKEP